MPWVLEGQFEKIVVAFFSFELQVYVADRLGHKPLPRYRRTGNSFDGSSEAVALSLARNCSQIRLQDDTRNTANELFVLVDVVIVGLEIGRHRGVGHIKRFGCPVGVEKLPEEIHCTNVPKQRATLF